MSKLRIASYYENRLGRNDGNPLYMFNAFKQIPGIQSDHLIPLGTFDKWGNGTFILRLIGEKMR